MIFLIILCGILLASLIGVSIALGECRSKKCVPASISRISALSDNLGTNKIKFWINAFIHESIPNVTSKMYGISYIQGPPFYDCFKTDQRGYSNNPSASARLHCEFTVDLRNKTYTTNTYCGTTHQIDCKNPFTVKCQQTASNKNMKFSDAYFSQDGSFFRIYLSAAGANPCVPLSPDIDFNGWFSVQLYSSYIKYTFTGKVDQFPNYECYAQLGSKTPITLFTLDPPAGKTPLDLFGNANRTVSVFSYGNYF